jgi:F-type H+-transporting ATPase subunit alpha
MKTSQLTEELEKSLPEAALRPVVTEIGEIIYVGDGVCKIKGLPTVHIDDVVEVETSRGMAKAMVLGISATEIEAVVLGEYTGIKQGDVVRSKGDLLRIQSGEAMLGRVVDPLGNPLDGMGPITSKILQAVERIAPGVAKREPVTQQLETGVLVVDALIPLGKGQRELIVGDRKSGKTSLIASFILNQKGRNMTCIYVAVGAQKAKVRALEQQLREGGAMDYTCIVMGSSDDPPSLNYIAPYSGCAIGEYFMFHGRDAFVIYDDLSKHAKAYRQMSLLLKRSPGRDAYPGDIFYLHSRLLERTCRINEKAGGGSLTGFPVAETQNGDLSEYIVTNLMSITDGHIFLDVNLMHEGIFPAVNSGASVSRIGGGVQPPSLRKTGELAGSQMARFNEVKSFETLNTEVSEDTEREIKRGKRILEIFAQEANENLSNDEKILLLQVVTSGHTDYVEVIDLHVIKTELIAFYRAHSYPEYAEKSVKEKDITVIEPMIVQILTDFIPECSIASAHLMIDPTWKPDPPSLPIIPDPQNQGGLSKSSASAMVSN